RLRNPTTGDQLAWGDTSLDTYPVTIVPGTYDVYYDLTATGTANLVPLNRSTRITTLTIVDDAVFDLNISTVMVDRTFTVNGRRLRDPTVNGYGRLPLRSAAGDLVSWGNTTEASAPVRIVPGSYDIYYEKLGLGTGAGDTAVVPANKVARL